MHGLELALKKTEAIVFTNKNKRNIMTVEYTQHAFPSSRCVKYLGVYFDSRLHFQEDAMQAAKRAAEARRCLTQILPNLRGAKQRTRRVLATVVTSRLLYGAPIWSTSITVKALGIMEAAYRRIMLRVACCYRTTSYTAAAVVASHSGSLGRRKIRHLQRKREESCQRGNAVQMAAQLGIAVRER
ncbi:uncharacterized protein LOC112680841 [Sipha flava]|uniref:Uncharacterized protein LOC112680841 n=1 Tax=Sipha flava TaxID=143950 RepID=A0A8B8F880_9HEMI|nr:uncharacterized protein LOC112680841 [Sipha flava]